MDIANPLWEMSSFSEASKAAALLAGMLADTPQSRQKNAPNQSGRFHSAFTDQA
ncbi:hypothetical protein J1G35_12215 [Pseudomonas sp. SH10-3B]|uniref:hypothetical protein n=1 Tax=Pseudomonas sp. SH10-3B TaxID=2816049 RepID=UPI001CA78C6C|nr:hypothetical protein [Pseudomonas sp. SH10-3B]MBY8946631.1 hypothetical protein [Pseudomonas sp. SH10-3B]